MERDTSAVPADVADRLLAEAFGRPRGYEALRELCDRVGGRISGTALGAAAEDWGLAWFHAAGLDRPRFDAFEVAVWERGWLDATVTGPNGWTLAALAHGFSPGSCDVTAPAIDVGHGLPEDYERLGGLARDSIALCDEGAPQGRRAPHRTEKLAWAAAYGAAGLMIGGSAPGCLPRTGVCHRARSPIPSMGISQEDAGRLQRALKDGLRPVVRIRMANSISTGVARNVLADIPGADLRDEIVLAGAHLDSWDVAQGATDNGLGCAIVLQAAHALAATGRSPRRTIRFALWAAEETGLHGSRRYVAENEQALDSIAAVMNFDMTGDPYGYWTPGHRAPHPLLRALADQLAPLGMRQDFSSAAGLHSDHQPFMLAGVPIVGLAARLPDGGGGHYYHSAGDTFEKVSLPALCRAGAVAAHTLWALADAPERPFSRLTPNEVDEMISEAGLSDAVAADRGAS